MKSLSVSSVAGRPRSSEETEAAAGRVHAGRSDGIIEVLPGVRCGKVTVALNCPMHSHAALSTHNFGEADMVVI
jgi:hypothetical protein